MCSLTAIIYADIIFEMLTICLRLHCTTRTCLWIHMCIYRNCMCICGFICASVDLTRLVSLPDSHNALLRLQRGRGSLFWGFPGCTLPLSPETAAHQAHPSVAATSARSLSLFPALSPGRRSSGPSPWSHPPAQRLYCITHGGRVWLFSFCK